MNTETNATIDEVMRASANATLAEVEYQNLPGMVRLDKVVESGLVLRRLVAAALDSQARQIEALTAERDRWEAAYREWIPASMFAHSLSNSGALPARDLGRHCGDVLIDHVKRLTAERDELRLSLAESMQAHAETQDRLTAARKPTTPAPGEWVEWRGERRPDGLVPDEVRLRDGSVLIGWLEGFWTWGTWSKYGRDIVAYRVIP